MRVPLNVLANNAAEQTRAMAESHRNILRMGKNDRTAGSMPHWEKPESPQEVSMEALTIASTGDSWQADAPPMALSYRAPPVTTSPEDEAFGFADLLDMINPLQHIPLVNLAYREITGDDIKPIGKIIGGAVFGGAIGAASSMVNVAVEHETGKDLPAHALAMLRDDETQTRYASEANQPEYKLSMAEQSSALAPDLPGTAIAFADLGYRQPSDHTPPNHGIFIERLSQSEQRENQMPNLPLKRAERTPHYNT